jgi:teichuronic acid biosynthesis glycosyltransferase TuaC
MKPIRVLTISHMFPTVASGWYGNFISRQAQHLRRYGVECSFLVGRPWAPWPLPYAPRWHKYGPDNPLVPPDGFEARLVHYFRPPGFAFRRFEGSVLAWALEGPARRWHRDCLFDLVLGVSMLPDAQAAVTVGRKLGLPVASLAVGSDVMIYPNRMTTLQRQLCHTLRQVDLPMGVSESICDRLKQTGACKREPLRVYLGRDNGAFVPTDDKNRVRGELGWACERVVAIYVGGLVPMKGIEELAIVSERLIQRHRHFTLVCVGDGPSRSLLENLRDRVGADAVVLAGLVPPKRMPLFLQASDFLVLPSHSEGMPQAILEAMDCGLPVVATRVGGIPETVLDGETGLLVPAGDARLLGDAMERMIVDEQWRMLAGRKGLQRAREVFDSERNTALFADTLKSLVTRSGDD